MDSSDPWIHFDESGKCSHCQNFEINMKPYWHPDEVGAKKLSQLSETIRTNGKSKEYDCIIGVSGGVDSSYLLYVAKDQMGLRPLAVHVDAGWNSELAVHNIEALTKGLGIELFTHVIDWEEMRDLQVAFLRSSVANQDIPQDHAFFAKLYEFAAENKIKYVLTGSNYATESILPRAWGYNAKDATQLLAIHKQFGTAPLKTFPIAGFFKSYIYYPYVLGMKVVTPLNLIPYDKNQAISYLTQRFGWTYYGGKHFESRWTRFFQSYYLPKKFGYDKRRAHLASLIVSGQMSRSAALAELQQPAHDEGTIAEDIEYVAKKLELSVSEFEALMALPNKEFTDYPNNKRAEEVMRKCKRALMRMGLIS